MAFAETEVTVIYFYNGNPKNKKFPKIGWKIKLEMTYTAISKKLYSL